MNAPTLHFIFQKVNERVYYDSEAFPHLVGALFNKCKQVENELNNKTD